MTAADSRKCFFIRLATVHIGLSSDNTFLKKVMFAKVSESVLPLPYHPMCAPLTSLSTHSSSGV